jgi:hypothetical protein
VIRLKKGVKPAVLEANAPAWTQNLLDKISRGEEPTKTEKARYRHPQVKEALRQETSKKCAYCESKFLHVSYGDVEHVTPKSLRPELTFEWDNLTLACEVCNTNKSVSEEVIDPYNQDPSEHIYFEGVVAVAWPGDDLGYNTERILKLNRVELLEARKERREAIYRTLEVVATTSNPLKREVLMEYLQVDEIAADKEFSAMSKEIVSRHLQRLELLLAAPVRCSD